MAGKFVSPCTAGSMNWSISYHEFWNSNGASRILVLVPGKDEQKSRKERRKEARQEKQKLRFLSWVQHQVSIFHFFKKK
jgi:hypothetical protein